MATVRELLTKWGFKVDTTPLEKFNRGIDKAKYKVDKIGKALTPITRDIKKYGVALLAFGTALTAAVVVPGLKLEDSLKNTLTLINATDDELAMLEDGMRKRAISLSNTLGIAATEVNEGFYQVLSAGAKPLSEDFNNLSEVALKLAKTIGVSSSESIEKLADTLGAYKLELKDAVFVADRFFKASQLAQTTVPQLMEAMRDAGVTAKDMGVSLEDTLSILSSFASGGIKGARAGTAFRMMMVKLGKPTDEAQTKLDKLGITFFDQQGKMKNVMVIMRELQTATKDMSDQERIAFSKVLVGEEAYTKLGLVLSSNIDKLEDWTKILEGADSALEKAFIIKMKSGIQQLNILKQKLVNVAGEIGLHVIPKITELGDKLNKYFTENKQKIIEWGKQLFDSIGSVIAKIVEYKDVLLDVGKILVLFWGVGKVVTYTLAIKEAIKLMKELMTIQIATGTAGAIRVGALVKGALPVAVTYYAQDILTKIASGHIDANLAKELAEADAKERYLIEARAIKAHKKVFSGTSFSDKKDQLKYRTEALSKLDKQDKKALLAVMSSGFTDENILDELMGDELRDKKKYPSFAFTSTFFDKHQKDKTKIGKSTLNRWKNDYDELQKYLAESLVNKKTGEKAGEEFGKGFAKGAKDKLAFLHPGFDKDIMESFSNFLTGGLGKDSPTAAVENMLSRKDVLLNRSSGNIQNDIKKSTTYYINGMTDDQLRRLEKSERDLMLDLAVASIPLL